MTHLDPQQPPRLTPAPPLDFICIQTRQPRSVGAKSEGCSTLSRLPFLRILLRTGAGSRVLVTGVTSKSNDGMDAAYLLRHSLLLIVSRLHKPHYSFSAHSALLLTVPRGLGNRAIASIAYETSRLSVECLGF
jgi:hypothetical protein